MVKKVGIITAGGDCPGLNAVIRGIVKTAEYANNYGIGFTSASLIVQHEERANLILEYELLKLEENAIREKHCNNVFGTDYNDSQYALESYKIFLEQAKFNDLTNNTPTSYYQEFYMGIRDIFGKHGLVKNRYKSKDVPPELHKAIQTSLEAVIKYRKVVYKGLAKNMNMLYMLCASTNLLMCIRAGRTEDFLRRRL